MYNTLVFALQQEGPGVDTWMADEMKKTQMENTSSTVIPTGSSETQPPTWFQNKSSWLNAMEAFTTFI